MKSLKLVFTLAVFLLAAGTLVHGWAEPAAEATAESSAADTPAADAPRIMTHDLSSGILREWNVRRTGIQKGGMIFLGSWALSNFVVSGYYMTRRENRDFYFHQMNVLWNTVNLAIAGFGYYGALGSPLDLGLLETVGEYRSFSKILAINAALDVGYVMGGFFMKSRADHSDKYRERLIGYGNSLILQGSFLFAFDVVMAMVNQGALAGLAEAGGVELSMIPGGIAARFSW